MEAFAKNIKQGQQALNGYQSIEASLQLAEHAEAWIWKEVEVKPEINHDSSEIAT